MVTPDAESQQMLIEQRSQLRTVVTSRRFGRRLQVTLDIEYSNLTTETEDHVLAMVLEISPDDRPKTVADSITAPFYQAQASLSSEPRTIAFGANREFTLKIEHEGTALVDFTVSKGDDVLGEFGFSLSAFSRVHADQLHIDTDGKFSLTTVEHE